MLCAVVYASPARAQQPVAAVLYDATLAPQPITLLELDTEAQRIVYEDARGERQDAAFADVLRLTFPVDAEEQPEPLPVLVTTDGQRIVGRAGQVLHAAHGTDDVVGWRDADGFPAIGVSLDALAWAVYQPEHAAPPQAQPADDVLVLANGEQLAGFVDALGVKHVGFVIGDADDAVEIGSDRVAALVMSNAMRAEAFPAVWVTMRSGSRWRCKVAAVSADGGPRTFGVSGPMQLAAPGGPGAGPVLHPVRLGSADHAEQDAWPVVSQIDLPAPGRRLVALSSLPMEVTEGGEVFGVAMPPSIAANGAIALHAPVSVAFDLPRGAARLAGTVALALGDVPAERHAWAGCEVVVSVGDAELARVPLDADQPEQAVNVALPDSARAQTLLLTVEEGVNGPVLDRVELRDVELLINE